MAHAIKFVHASDFHLDRPIVGLSQIPTHLKSTLANAAYAAATRVFDLALAEKVDFVLLSGDIVDLEAGGPRASAFLLSQFERLGDRGIEVYWCSGQVDQPDRWPSAVDMPDNVLIFNSNATDRVVHNRDNHAIATIYGSGYENKKRGPHEHAADPDDAFPIAFAYGEFDQSTIGSQNIRYWALGGLHKRLVIEKTTTLVVYPGTVQSRSIAELGGHGCTICRVDSKGQIRCVAHEFDEVRWYHEKIAVAENSTLQDIKNLLSDRVSKIAAESSDQVALVAWQLSTTGELNPEIHTSEWREELTDWLRKEYGQSERGVWTTSFEVVKPKSLPQAWYEEDTMLGDYLRAVGRYQSDDSLSISLHEFLPAATEEELVAGIARPDPKSREKILREVAWVGVERLGLNEKVDHLKS